MTNCQQCGTPLFRKSQKKFCGSSCAATYNNQKFPKRSVESRCAHCDTPIPTKNKYCPECRFTRFDTVKDRKRKYSDEELLKAVDSSTSVRQVILKLGLREAGGNYSSIKERISFLDLDASHFTGEAWGGFKFKEKTPWEDILIENGTKFGEGRKQRAFDEGLLNNMCYSCGIGPMWNDKLLILHIEHINGNPRDNRLENLSILCPNCHSQTATWCRAKKPRNGSN